MEIENMGYKDLLDPINDLQYKKLLNKTEDLYNNTIEYGIYIMNEILSDYHNEKKQLQAASFTLLRESLEVLDGINILIKNSCFNSSTPLIRNLFELFIYNNYIFLDQTLIEEKLIVYQIQEIEREIFFSKKLEEKEKDYIKKNTIIKKRLELEKKVKAEKYLKYHNYFESNKKYINNWYTFFGEKTFFSICKKTGNTKHYDSIYNILSHKAHGNASMRGINHANNEISIEGFRMPKNISNVELPILFISSIYKTVINYHLKPTDIKNFGIWYSKELFPQRERVVSAWKNLNIIEE